MTKVDVIDTATVDISHIEIANQLVEYGKATHGTAVKCRIRCDPFGGYLASARAEIYDTAAELVRTQPLTEAAREMMRHAISHSVRTPPLFDFDEAGLSYIRARAWQWCAWQIDPSLPEVQALWD